MSSSTPANYVQSPEFPENYGDFRLISSDGVIFSFPRFLLAHISPVFKDMLEIGTGNPMGQQAELRLAENSTTLNQLLRLLDPAKKPLPIHMDTVEELLESARKYQVERVFEYWQEQMKVQDDDDEVVKIRHPMISFLLGGRFRRDELTRLALRELIRAPDTSLYLSEKGFTVDHRVMTYVSRLRQERSEKLIARIHAYQSRALPQYCCEKDGLIMMRSATPSLTLELIKEPSWNTFEKNMDIWSDCSSTDVQHLQCAKVVLTSGKRRYWRRRWLCQKYPNISRLA
ncbi:hypothetical protein FRC19_007687, partial [Serendipita sp. 401]